MNRFWAAGSSDDSSSDSDGSSSYSSSDDSGVKGGAPKRWMEFSDDSDSEEEVRVVKSAKERALDAFTAHIKNLRSFTKQRDFKKIQSEFDVLSKAMIKAKKILAAGIPKELVRILVDLEDFIAERLADKEAFKKLTPNQGRALNRMKLTLKKHNKPYQVVMAHYRKNPSKANDIESDSDKSSSSSSSNSDKSDSDSSSSSSSSSDSDSDSDSSSSSSNSSGDDGDDWGASSDDDNSIDDVD
eukprot:CAMPEP_0194177202 /NCGR_PEP_ID=MMETSP0154-20130528/11009_1 /TAXON_ID=1049557 /ORGANISM="Thalassiothrix antarctica, Strain L6-D1" /LENGTH=241 /DNA_ID=CAMNT_0038891703 /DNA_START=82 /DNA_END=807 /DNA_ORIENTATION=-